MEAKATLRYARVAPNKVRQVIANVRDLPVEDARELLLLETKAVARDIRKVLDSAVANAENNHGLDPDELFVTGAVVDEGPVLRRFRPRAMGRATRIRKRTSHITITVGDGEEEESVLAPVGGATVPEEADASENTVATEDAAADETAHEETDSDEATADTDSDEASEDTDPDDTRESPDASGDAEESDSSEGEK